MLKEWNMFKIFSYHFISICFRSDKHPHLDWYSVFGHIGFEAKQEMKPYYNIAHKAFQAAILRQLRQFFSRWSQPCE